MFSLSSLWRAVTLICGGMGLLSAAYHDVPYLRVYLLIGVLAAAVAGCWALRASGRLWVRLVAAGLLFGGICFVAGYIHAWGLCLLGPIRTGQLPGEDREILALLLLILFPMASMLAVLCLRAWVFVINVRQSELE